MSTTREWTKIMSDAAPLAQKSIKEVLREIDCKPIQQTFQQMRTGDLPTYQAMLKSNDAKEGIAAFFEKRKPVFKGH